MKKLAAFLSLALAACASLPSTPPALAPVTQPATTTASMPAEARQPVTILISIDGFRPDYLDRGVTPNLNRLKAAGISASMRPAFPSKTYPNHWTLVTGLVPDRHGIVSNNMDDPTGAHPPFTLATDDPWWWNAAEPIWVTAEKVGIRTATMFWPGSNVGWGGVRREGGHGEVDGATRPRDWQQFNQSVTGDQRVDAVIDWLRRPAATRPRFVTLYFDTVDSAGHASGPDSAQVTEAAADVDRLIGRLTDGLAALNQAANLVIVSDHGMAATSSTRTIALDGVLAPADATIGETGPYAGITPTPGREAAVAQALAAPHPHMQCWRKDRIPPRFRYGGNPRVPPYICLAATGWSIVKRLPERPFSGGNHGYDHQSAEMRALFIAQGPAFVAGRRLSVFDNVDIAPLLRDLLGLPAGQGLDGSDAPFRKVMR